MRRPNNSFSCSGCTIALVAMAALLLFPTATSAGWVATQYDFDPDPSAEFALFINPFGSPVDLSGEVGVGTGGSDGVKFTPMGGGPGESEFSVLPLGTGSLAGAADSLTQSIDFQFTDLGSEALVGMGIGDGPGIVLLETYASGPSDLTVSTFTTEGGTPSGSVLGTATPSSILNWFRLEMTFTSTGDDVTMVGGLFDLGSTGTDTPSLEFAVNHTLTNATIANATSISPGYRVFSTNGVASTDVTYVDNFTLVPEPSTVILAAMGLVGLLAFGCRRRR